MIGITIGIGTMIVGGVIFYKAIKLAFKETMHPKLPNWPN